MGPHIHHIHHIPHIALSKCKTDVYVIKFLYKAGHQWWINKRKGRE
jgi:hypothetical protein